MQNVKRIKIYRHHDDTEDMVGNCLVNLNDPPKIYDCKPDPGEDVREVIEETLKHGRNISGGAGRGPIVPINNVDYSWNFEDVTAETKPKKKGLRPGKGSRPRKPISERRIRHRKPAS